MSDWGATHSTTRAANAGLDQEFWEERYFAGALKAAVEKGEVSEKRIDDMARRILRSLAAIGALDRAETCSLSTPRRALPSHSASPKAASSCWRTAEDCCRFGRRA